MNRRYAAILIALIVAIVAMFCSRDRKRFFTHEGVVWTTEYHITYEARNDLGDSIQLILGNLDMSVSPYNKASLISAINENKTTRTDGHLQLQERHPALPCPARQPAAVRRDGQSDIAWRHPVEI